jgi:hypothetical protein
VAEFDELRLKITLIDEASTGIKIFTSSLISLGNATSKSVAPHLAQASQGIAKVSQETRTLQTRIRSAVGDFSNLTSTMIGIGQGVGLIGRMPLALGGLIGIIAGINSALVQFSQRMLDLRGKAQAAGLVPDQFMNISEQLQKFGASAEEAESDIVSFHRTVREANKGGTAEFNRIFSEARDPQNVVRFANYLQELINSGQSEKAISLVAERARKIFDRELKKTGGSRAEATRQAESFLSLFGLTMRALQIENLAPFDNATKWQERIDLAAKFWVEWTKVLKVLDDMQAGIQKELLPSFTELNKALAGLGVGWGETIGASIATTLREIKAILAGINWVLGRGGSTGGGLPGIFGGGGGGGGTQQWDPRAPYRREGTTAPSLGQQAPGAATPGPGLGVPGFGVPFGGSPPPAAPGGDMFSDRFGIWPGGGGKPIGSDVGPGYGAGAFGVPSSGVLSGGAGARSGAGAGGAGAAAASAGGGLYTSSRSPRLQNLITTNPTVRGALQIPRLPGESDAAWIARGRRALEGTGAGKISYEGGGGIPGPAPFGKPGEGPATYYPGTAGVGRFGGGFLGQAERIGKSQWEGGNLPAPGELKNVEKELEILSRRGGPENIQEQPGWPQLQRDFEYPQGMPMSLDRGVLDRSMGAPLAGPQRVEGGGNVNVNITDRGSKVEASGSGMFEGNVETSRERVTGL